MPDFVSLASHARNAPTKEHLDELWSAMFQLSHWFFIPIPGVGGQFSPYVGVVGNQRWVMTFTDQPSAAAYAIAARIAMPGGAPSLELAPRAAAVHIPAMRALGVLGVLVNPGPEAFYTPFENLRQMLDYFQTRPPMPAGPRGPVPQPPPPPLPGQPLAYAPTQPVKPPPPPLPTQRLTREALVELVQRASDDHAFLPQAIAALRLEPEWFVIATKANPALPQLEIWADGRMAALVYTDKRTAETMQQLMAMVPGDAAPLIPMSPESAIARFAHEDMVELVVFNPRGEQLLVPLGQLH